MEPEKRKGGRPRSVRRDKKVNTYFLEGEYEEVDAAARERGLSVAAYVRTVVLADARRTHKQERE